MYARIHYMTMRKHLPFAIGEYYHIYNRGVEKRTITQDWKDSERFLESIVEFNSIKSLGGLYLKQFGSHNQETIRLRSSASKSEKLVEVVAYCLNPNHYHLILTPLVENGIEKFMQKLGTGFTKYFNEKYNRTGSLFQGRFKSSHINSNEYLLHVGTYINLNDMVHKLRSSASKLVRSSWWEYVGDVSDVKVGKSLDKKQKGICNKDIILGQFENVKEYEKSAKEALRFTLENRYDGGELSMDLLAQDEYPDMFERGGE